MARDDVHIDLKPLVLLQPRLQRGERRRDDLPGDRLDASAALRKLDEARRRNDCAVRLAPARQDLAAEDRSGCEVEDRLQEGLELAGGKRPVEFGDGVFRSRRDARQQEAEGQAENGPKGQDGNVRFAVPSLECARLDPDRGAQRISVGRHDEAGDIGGAGALPGGHVVGDRLPVAQLEQHFAVLTQLGRHDVEQVGAHAEDRDEVPSASDPLRTPSAVP